MAERQVFVGEVQIHEEGVEEYFTEGRQVQEDQAAAPPTGIVPRIMHHRRQLGVS